MEGKIMERPRVPYSEIFDTIDGHQHITYEERLQVKAIDMMVDALLLVEPDIEGKFGGYTLGDKSRLTNRDDPNYGEDLLMSIHTPGEFFSKVCARYKPNIDDNGLVIEDGFMYNWGEQLKREAKPSNGDRADDAESKVLVNEIVEVHAVAFKLETAPTLV